MLKPGDAAPDFSVQDHHGKQVSLQDFRGKTVVLWFYPKADTPGCTAEGCSFRDLDADFKAKNAVILGVSFDDAAANAAFAKKYNFKFPLLCDTARTLGMAYGACDDAKATHAKRIGIVINGEGKVRGYYPQVDARVWPAEVVTTL
jgi:peroxiredoxin Q/BCP